MVEDYEAEAERVFWTSDRLIDEGMEPALAMELALQHRDWHDVEDLIRAGCDPQLAGRIVL